MVRWTTLSLLALSLARATAVYAEPGEEPVDFGVIEGEDADVADTPSAGAPTAKAAAVGPTKPAAPTVQPTKAAPPAMQPSAPAPEPRGKPERKPKGIHIGMHLGLRLVLGDYGDGRPATVISGPGVRGRTDFGYAIDPRLVLGGYFKGAYGERGSALKQLCEEDDDLVCLSSLLGLGVAVSYLPLPDARLSPWLRYSAGISVVYTSSDPFTPDHFVGGLSLDFATLGLGLDLNVNRFLGIGAFVELGAGTYLTGFEVHEDDSDSSAVQNGALHYDLDLGLRVLFRI